MVDYDERMDDNEVAIPMFSQFERQGPALSCSSCGEVIFPAGVCVGPVLNEDGSFSHSTGARSLWARCTQGHEMRIDLGIMGRIHAQFNEPSASMRGIFVR